MQPDNRNFNPGNAIIQGERKPERQPRTGEEQFFFPVKELKKTAQRWYRAGQSHIRDKPYASRSLRPSLTRGECSMHRHDPLSLWHRYDLAMASLRPRYDLAMALREARDFGGRPSVFRRHFGEGEWG